MKISALLAAMLLSGSMVFAQNQKDPVLMTINGHQVHRSEFEYSYNKNNSEGVIDKKSVSEYVDLFINYKLKVQAALDAHLDTLSSFKKEFDTYRDQQVLPTMITDADVEAKAQQIYKETQQRIDGAGGMIMPAHILFLLNQKATKAQQDSVERLANDVYRQLQRGADFAALAKKYSGDKGSAAQGGKLPWITKGETVPAFEEAAFALQKGEMSKPVLSPFGYHIILMKDRGNFYPYDSVHANILQFIEARNLRESIAKEKLDAMVKERGNGTTRESILDARAAELSISDPNMKYLIQEYHDGLLLYEISNRMIWDKAAKDEEGLTYYFKKNKKKYMWDASRFKGIAYHVKTKGDVDEIKKCLKGQSFEKWADILRNTFNSDSVIRVRAEKGIFKKGDNGVVDRDVFHKDTTVTALKEFPIDGVYGKELKKGPESYLDVKAQVVADYQEVLEKLWLQDLRKKYDFTVDKDVLSTVNKHK